MLTKLDYSRVEVDADARHSPWSCGPSPRMGYNAAYAVRSARLKCKECRWYRGK